MAVTLGAGMIWLGRDSNPGSIAAVDSTPVEDRSGGIPDPTDPTDGADGVGRGEGVEQVAGWAPLPDPALVTRAHTVSVWTDSGALFWGGRTDADADGVGVQAFVGGALLDPTTGRWSDIRAPQWGHPGAAGAYHDGWVYVQAKGGVTRFDPLTGIEET